MPPPVAFAAPGAVAAAKQIAFRAAAYVDVTTFTSATFAAILARWIWKRIPLWIKEDLSFRNLVRCHTDDDCVIHNTNNNNNTSSKREEMSHLGSVFSKIQELAQSTSNNVDANIPQIHAALLAYIQLSGQWKKQQIENTNDSTTVPETLTRDYRYKSAGTPVPLCQVQSPEYQNALRYSTWAYYDDTNIITHRLQEHDFTLIRHYQSTRPGNVAYYLAVSHTKQQVLVGIRGTSTLEELVTDCCGCAVPLLENGEDTIHDNLRIEVEACRPNEIRMIDNFTDYDDEEDDNNEEDVNIFDINVDIEVISGHERILCEDHDEEGDNFTRCHEGILISAKRMVNKLEPELDHWVSSRHNNSVGYDLLLCGHSLGGGAATLAALILRSRHSQWRERVKVYAFAPPPVLDHDSAIAASSFCTSIVHNADLIPRCSLSNLSVFLDCLRAVHQRLVEEDLNPIGPYTTRDFIRHLSRGIDGKALMKLSDFNKTIEQAQERISLRKPDHLYIPGKVLLLYQPWMEDRVEDGGEDEEREEDGGEDEDKDDDDNSDSDVGYSFLLKCVETDGTAAVFRTLEVDGPRLFTDHVTSSYYEALGMDYHF